LKKKLSLVLILLVLIVSFITFDDRVFYKELPISGPIIEPIAADAPRDNASPICSVDFSNVKNQASIMPLTGEKIEIITVEKSKNVGIDVIYKIVKAPDLNAKPQGQQVEFLNLFGSPVGFVLES